MKYQSEIIHEILEQRGHEKSSLHYQSECIETWIEESKGAYPKLTDYESDWLNYISILDDKGGSEEPPIGEFPYIVLSDVTEATVDNVVPLAYKSAILKGCTLVNIHPTKYLIGAAGPSTFYASVEINSSLIKPNTKYFLRLYNTHISVMSAYFKPCVTAKLNLLSNNKCAIFTTKGEFSNTDLSYNKIHFYSSESLTTEDVKNTKILLCEYQDGMENWDIPYFEGMQSVKLPVLTTSNGDGTKTNILTVNEDVTLRSNGNICDELNLLTGQLTQRIDEDGEVLSQEVVKTVDLSIADENGNEINFVPIEGTMHIQTDGEPIKPSVTMEIPVEATTQNLASFIEGE